MKMGEGGDVDALMSKMDRLQTEIDAIDGWEIDRQLDRAMDALRCPPGAAPPPPPPIPSISSPSPHPKPHVQTA